LAQNPDIHATPTDGFLELIYAARVNFTEAVEFKAQDEKQMMNAWRGFCRRGMEGYCEGLSSRPNTCIKSRGIGCNFDWFKSFMGEDPKVIVMVRNIKAVLASMEKIHRANPDRARSVQDPSRMLGLTTESRVDQWLNTAPVGLALQRLQQMQLEGTAKKCLIVRFEDLTTHPAEVMGRVYEYLGLPSFRHDFDNVEQITQEDDAFYGLAPNLHSVRKKVRPLAADYEDVLGSNLCAQIDNRCHGYQATFGYLD